MPKRYILLHVKKLALGLVLLPLFLLFSCNTSDLFEEYRGVNLISSYAFDSAGWTKDRSESYYMNFESVTAAEAGTTSGLPDGAAIYRLEIPNLMPDGDFETTTAGSLPAGWSDTGGTNQVAATGIYGQSLAYDIDNTQRLNFTLSTVADSFSANGYYLIRFLLNQPAAVFDYHDGTSSSFLAKPWKLAGLSGVTAFPTTEDDPEILAQTGGTFSINDIAQTESIVQSGKLDNFRVVRTDISNTVSLNVPYQETDRLDLLPGTYRFSVYIKQEPASNISPTVKNRFPATGITLQIEGTPDYISNGYAYAVHYPTDEGVDWSSWTQISVDIHGLNPSSQPDVGIDVSITPNDINDKDVGSILIASPSLEFLPDS